MSRDGDTAVKRALMGAILGISLAGLTTVASAQGNGQRPFVDEGCAVCHGLMGEGGVGPKLAGDNFLRSWHLTLGMILLGAGEMPPFAGKMSDQQVAEVASYIRESWGNHFGKVTAQDVTTEKASLPRLHASAGKGGQLPGSEHSGH